MAEKLLDKDGSYFDLEKSEQYVLGVNLQRFQAVAHKWRQHNFPNADPTQQALGVAEEMGELAHAHLKHVQGIRDGVDDEATEALEKDAIGDIMMYLLGYCSYRGFELADCLYDAWQECKTRDWVKYPKNGVNE